MRRKIVHISSSPFEYMKGGVPTYVERLVKWQRENGLEAYEMVRRGNAKWSISRPGVVLVDTNPALGRFQGAAFRRAIASFKASNDLICVHYLPHILWSPALLLSGRFVMYFHGPAALEAQSEGAGYVYCQALRVIERFVYGRCAHIICLSAAFKDVLVNYYGVDPTRITVIPGHLGVDLIEVDRRPKCRERGLRVVTVRRLRERMGLEVLVDAFSLLLSAPNMQDSRLTIIGDGPLRKRLQEQVDRLGLSESVILTGPVSNEERDALLNESDVFVLPTRVLEGFGMVVLEALAQGLPVIASDVGGIPEILKSIGWGDLLVPAGSAEKLAEKLLYYASLPEPPKVPVAQVNSLYSLKELGIRHSSVYSLI